MGGLVKTRPSAAGRRVPCPGSVVQEAQFPDVEDDSTREGTAAHWAGERLLMLHSVSVGDKAPNGVIITDVILEHASAYSEWVHEEYTLKGFDLHIEEYVEIPAMYEGYGGTPDLWGFNPELKRLKKCDFKYGYGIVEADFNRQLLDYAAGIVRKFGLDVSGGIELIVYQPRPPHSDGHIRKWLITSEMLWEAEKLSYNTIQEARGPNPRIIAGPHCRDCKAIVPCPAATNAVLNAITVTEKIRLNNPTPIEMARLIELFDMAEKMVKAMKKGVDLLAENKLMAGELIPGYGLERAYGHAKMTRSPEFMASIAKLYGVEPDDIINTALKTPNQIIKAGIPEAIVKPYSVRPVNSSKLKKVNIDKKIKELFYHD